MSEVKRKVLACAVSVVMAFSMVSATSLSAFADDLAAGVGMLESQSSEGPIVYDTAYGVIGGQYALMMKTVTYEAQYKGKTQSYTATITDLMRADGEVTVHTSNATVDGDGFPGPWTDYRWNAVVGMGQDIEEGYMEVSDKTTGKSGVKSVDGAEILPCSYDNISALEDGFLAFTFEDGIVKYDFFTKDGTPAGSFSSPGKEGRAWAYATYYDGGYVKLTVQYSGDALVAIAHKEGSEYVQDNDITEIYSASGDGGFLCAKSDGNVHYRAADGSDTVIATAAGVTSASVTYGLVALRYDREGTALYNISGVKLKDAGVGVESAVMESSFVFKPFGHDDANATYELYDYSGTLLKSFAAANVGSLDAGHFYATTYAASRDDYTLSIYGPDGRLVKERSGTQSASARVDPCKKWVGEKRGSVHYDRDYVLVGYQLNDDGSYVYYDPEFNEMSYNPASVAQVLPDGTKVIVQLDSKYNPNTRVRENFATTTDEAGNPVKLGDYTLGVPTDERTYFPWNSIKHGNSDLWWASNAEGMWGAVDSTGAVVVPFEYESYYDAGFANTDYAMVRKDGVWQFLKVSNGVSGPDATMHRLYNPNSGEHFYTSNDQEFADLVALGWVDEGAGWIAPSMSNTPVYRLYNPYAGEHHYCMSAQERDDLVAAGWSDEGVGWYSDDAKTTPLFREYNPNAFANNHNYTIDAAEHQMLMEAGWVDEGYAWYGL